MASPLQSLLLCPEVILHRSMGFNSHGQDCILRITPANQDVNLHSTCQILEWLAFLAERGGPVSKPIRSLQGNLN